MNGRNNSVILGKRAKPEIAGIPVRSEVKYLGLRINLEKSKTLQNCKNDIQKSLGHLKFKVRGCCLDVKEHILMAFSRSLAIYFLTPLTVAKILKE